MSEDSSKIQKFDEFKPMKKKWKMNKLYISGTLKGTFLQKKKDFEMVISFTRFKQLIIDIHIDDISLQDKRLCIDFVIGDNIKNAKDWVDKMGFKIDMEMIR